MFDILVYWIIECNFFKYVYVFLGEWIFGLDMILISGVFWWFKLINEYLFLCVDLLVFFFMWRWVILICFVLLLILILIYLFLLIGWLNWEIWYVFGLFG